MRGQASVKRRLEKSERHSIYSIPMAQVEEVVARVSGSHNRLKFLLNF